MKRGFIINSIIIVLALIAFLSGYLLSQDSNHRQSSNQGSSILSRFSDQPAAKTSGPDISVISGHRAVSLVNAPDRGVNYYEKGTGKTFFISFDYFRESPITQVAVPNFIKAIWSPNGKDSVILSYSEKGTLYKFASDLRMVDLPLGIQSLVFSPSGDSIAYFIPATDTGTIFISKPDGSAPRPIFTTRLTKIDLAWPSEDTLSLLAQDVSGNYQLFSLSKEGALRQLLPDTPNLSAKWAPDGNSFIYSQAESGDRPTLYLNEVSLESTVQINLATNASQCAWSIDSRHLACYGTAQDSKTGFYQIDPTDRSIHLVATPNTAPDIDTLFFSKLENYLIFLDRRDNHVYAVKMP